MRVAVLNVKFSPNLGDGLLAECLEAELRESLPGIETVAIDLAGRTSYGQGGMRNRRLALAALDMMPAALRRFAVGLMLGRVAKHRLRPAWRTILAEADAVVLGGGNLLADSDLNFPIKIRAALREAAEADLAVGVFGVGVADNWSVPGETMFRQALKGVRLCYASVRDTRSLEIWRRRLTSVGIADAVVCRDPAVLTARHFPSASRTEGPPRVALGLTDPLALRYHSDVAIASDADLTEWMMALARAMLEKGWRVSVFTNGSPEDRTYLEELTPRLRALSGKGLEVVSAFETPSELAQFISAHDLVMAHRLHACICSFAYAIPTIGFTWDKKLNSFFESVGLGRYIVDAGIAPVASTLALAEQAMADGPDQAGHDQIVEETRNQVADLARALSAAAKK